MKNLTDWLSWQQTQHAKEIDLGLDRIANVASRLDLAFSIPVVTVAGTNGKGSCIASLSAILQAADYRVAAYTSPHLIIYNERVCLFGKPVSDKMLCQAFEAIEHARDSVSLSFFEWGTLAALWIFKQHEPELDVILLEIGLGGRLDAVNIIEPTVAVVTNVDFDHQSWLGDDRESIAFEKAGIFRKNIPAICGDPDVPVRLREQASLLNLPLYCQEKEFYYERHQEDWSWHSDKRAIHALPFSSLHLQNISSALMALSCLKFQISDHAIRTALSNVSLAGRFQCIDNTLLDVAHNPQAARHLAEHLKDNPPEGRNIAVLGMLADKDLAGTLAPLSSLIDEWFVSQLSESRAASADLLFDELVQQGANNTVIAPTIEDAYKQALKSAESIDRIVVFGSFHTVGAVLQQVWAFPK